MQNQEKSIKTIKKVHPAKSVGGTKGIVVTDTATLWKELHLRALNYTVGEKKSDASWLLAWTRKIPRFTKGCRCNEHWQKWYGKNRPDYSSSEAYFAWTVQAHNAVNERLKKPTWEVEQAREHYLKLSPAAK